MKSYKASPGTLGFTRPNSMLVCITALVFLSSLFVPTRAHAFGCSTAQGTVRDTLGRPIAGATVALVGEACESREYQTGTDGSFVTRISGVISTKTVLVTKPGFVDLSTEVYSDSHPLKDNDFTLKFAHVIDATPYAQRSGNVEVITARTVAPPSVDIRVDVKRDSDLIATELAYSHSDDGWNYFRGEFSHPVGDPTRYYTLASCAVRSSFSGSCQEAALVSGALLSEVGQSAYWIDDIAPQIKTVWPPQAKNSFRRRPQILVKATDTESGLSGARLWVDGQEVATTLTSSGPGYCAKVVCGIGHEPGTWYAYWNPPTDLSLGLHEVRYEVTDKAGNTTPGSWQFAIVAFTPQRPTGSLRSQTVDVNPSGSLVNAPTKVTFHNVYIDLSDFTADLSPAPFTGFDSLTTDISLEGAKVLFTNETPYSPEPIHAGLYRMTFEKFAGVLLPTSGSSKISFPGDSKVVASVTVDVPPGYNTQGSRATIFMPEEEGSTPKFYNEWMGMSFPFTTPVIASLSETVEVTESSPEGVAIGPGTSPKAYAYATVSNFPPIYQPVSVYRDGIVPSSPYGYSGPRQYFDASPDPVCATAQPCVVNGTGEGDPSFITSSRSSIEFGEGTLQFFANQFLYLEKDQGNSTNNYIDWHQASALMDPEAGCLKSFTSTSTPLNEGWTLSQLKKTEESTKLNDPPTFEGKIQWQSRPASFSSLTQRGMASADSSFKEDLLSRSTSWSLKPNAAPLTWSPQQMVSAFEWQSPSYPRSLTLQRSHTVSFVVGECV